jgi:hypothetical protein
MNDIPFNLATATLVIGVLNAGGAAVKAIPWISNHYIPFILAALGSVMYSGIEGWTGLNAVIGVGLAWGAVGLHQTVRQVANIKKDQ